MLLHLTRYENKRGNFRDGTDRSIYSELQTSRNIYNVKIHISVL